MIAMEGKADRARLLTLQPSIVTALTAIDDPWNVGKGWVADLG